MAGCSACGAADGPCGAAASKGDEFDVLVIGAGVVGAAIARELAKRQCKTLVLEKEADVCQGASKANSGIVHGGYDAMHGTLKSQLSRRGNQMFRALDEELDFGFKQIGSLVLAFTEAEVAKLADLKRNGELNGVDDLEMLTGEQVRAREPHVSVGVRGALWCPSAGVISPYEYCFALVENAATNGVQFMVEQEVKGIDVLNDLATRERVFRVFTSGGRVFKARAVINCAGLHADEVARMVDAGTKYEIMARKGEYVILEKSQGEMAKSVIFQTPTARWGKGILVSPTARGNLVLGPSAAEQDDKLAKDTDLEELAYVAWAARRSVPHLDTREVLTSFAGLRARCSRKDFIIEEDAKVKRFVHVAGIESPGLTSSPAIAKRVMEILKRDCGLDFEPNPRFAPRRKHPVDFDKPAIRAPASAKEGEDMGPSELVCYCENVTRGEIEKAIDMAGVPVRCTDSVKWRTRAGMGHCQGARCRARVAELVADKLGDGTSFQDIPKRVPGEAEPKRVPRRELSRL